MFVGGNLGNEMRTLELKGKVEAMSGLKPPGREINGHHDYLLAATEDGLF